MDLDHIFYKILVGKSVELCCSNNLILNELWKGVEWIVAGRLNIIIPFREVLISISACKQGASQGFGQICRPGRRASNERDWNLIQTLAVFWVNDNTYTVKAIDGIKM